MRMADAHCGSSELLRGKPCAIYLNFSCCEGFRSETATGSVSREIKFAQARIHKCFVWLSDLQQNIKRIVCVRRFAWYPLCRDVQLTVRGRLNLRLNWFNSPVRRVTS